MPNFRVVMNEQLCWEVVIKARNEEHALEKAHKSFERFRDVGNCTVIEQEVEVEDLTDEKADF